MKNAIWKTVVLLIIWFISFSTMPALAQAPPRVTVSPNDFQIDFGGEFDAVVIPPGLKKECPSGRVLASNDGNILNGLLSSGIAAGAAESVVIGRDFDGMNRIAAQFDAVPNPNDHGWVTNDHDLVSSTRRHHSLARRGSAQNADLAEAGMV
jgi:hypothetical protein